MPVSHYRSTIEVDAVQYEGADVNGAEVETFLGSAFQGTNVDPDQVFVQTPVGVTPLEVGSYVVQRADGSFDVLGAGTFSADFVEFSA